MSADYTSASVVSAAPQPARSKFTAGRDLRPGIYYRAISNGQGEVLDSELYLLVTTVTDKKGNRQLVNTSNGEVLFATPSSIWSA